ncbi:MAG: HNH endonuclease [Planctomycetes bacterium]|nr:HNH endonuclease [Planctomycetota bacterium]
MSVALSLPNVLGQPTLVLNRFWVAIQTTTVRKALCLLYSGAAHAISPETLEAYDFQSWADLSVASGEPAVRTVSLVLRVPEVILLRGFDGFPRKQVPFTRKNIYRRDSYTCQYCGAQPGTPELSIDHVLPLSRGGKNTWTNCVLACLRCNKRKGNRTPDESGLRLRRRPHRPSWNPVLSIPVCRKLHSWEKFISEAYWNTELES